MRSLTAAMSATAAYTAISVHSPSDKSSAPFTQSRTRKPSISLPPILRPTWAAKWAKALAFCVLLLVGANFVSSPAGASALERFGDVSVRRLPERVTEVQPEHTMQLEAPQTPHRVGPRRFPGLYQGCSSSELLKSLAAARIREDGPSRMPFNWTSSEVPLDSFEFSYDFEGCPQPHVFTPTEACDLLNSFGGVFLRGDSLMRHLSQGIFMLLTKSFDIFWDIPKEDCRGNKGLTNNKCRFHSKFDAREFELAKQFCAPAEVAPVRYQQLYSWKAEHHPSNHDQLQPYAKGSAHRTSVSVLSSALQRTYADFVASLAPERERLSPVYIHGTGIHYTFNTKHSNDYHVQPFLRTMESASPRPLALWSLNPAPGSNKPPQFKIQQGAEATRRYNNKMTDILNKETGGEGNEMQAARGAWAALDFYNTTDGAFSFDGTHYGYQVTMERAQVLMNYLDVVWSEVVELGGLVQM